MTEHEFAVDRTALAHQQLSVDPLPLRWAQERHEVGRVAQLAQSVERRRVPNSALETIGIQPVSVAPGLITFAVTWRWASSFAAARTTRSSAPLVAP